MPRLIETESRTGAVVAAINHLIARDGTAALSIRAIARESGVSASSLLHHYGNRERIIRLAALRTGKARLLAISRRIESEGVLAFLPHDLEDVIDARTWLGWLELWRSEDMLINAVGKTRREERALLAFALDHRVPADELDALFALIEGLTAAVCAPVWPLPLPQARSILHTQQDLALDRWPRGSLKRPRRSA